MAQLDHSPTQKKKKKKRTLIHITPVSASEHVGSVWVWVVVRRRWWPVVVVVVVSACCVPGVRGHGRLMDPPSRSSLWRLGFHNPPNYDDNQLFCGGFNLQWERYGGRCGLCGDPWPGPRDNEPGGRYANGLISRKYRVGQVIEVYVQLTANHKGYFEFRLCQHENPLTNITQECLDRHLLHLAQDSSQGGGSGSGAYSSTQDLRIKLRLPRGLTCRACVLQWKYNAGNSWGVDRLTHTGCVGCGPQEQFYGCADVAIGHDEVVVGVPPERFPWFSAGHTVTTGGAQHVTGHRFSSPQPTAPPHNTANPGEATRHQPDSEWHYGIAYVFGKWTEFTQVVKKWSQK
ncbi:uncharacterized protein LOC143292274 [Babylonia areolata]|uniref:uncharacterized protein LOC143292274 n=1 Tax=Babylonia areolata TaxID=304850 RepID=UPI003FD6B240